MNTTILFSTLLLTVLLSVGLFFFIKASVKDRTEAVQLTSDLPQEFLAAQLQQYFTQRAYQVANLDRVQNQVTFQGFVRPSWFLAIFLTLLTSIGILCLALVLAFLFPQKAALFLGLELLSPIAGIFYWRKAGRSEQVSLKFETTDTQGIERMPILVTVTAHRDELAALQRTLGLRPSEGANLKSGA